MKTKLKELAPYITLYRDETGIAWVENGIVGLGHSCHANINVSGSVSEMKKLGYWRKDDRIVESHGWMYNIDWCVVSDEYDEIARQHCQCGGKH